MRIERTAGGRLAADFTAPHLPEEGPAPPPRESVAEVLSITADELAPSPLVPVALSAGVPFLFVPVRDADVLGRVRLDPGEWQRRLAAFWAPHVYVFAGDTLAAAPTAESVTSPVRARMFAPAMGIMEDPATGAAAAAFAALLARHHAAPDGTLRRTIEQGVEMGRPSRIELHVEKRGGTDGNHRTAAV